MQIDVCLCLCLYVGTSSRRQSHSFFNSSRRLKLISKGAEHQLEQQSVICQEIIFLFLSRELKYYQRMIDLDTSFSSNDAKPAYVASEYLKSNQAICSAYFTSYLTRSQSAYESILNVFVSV